MGFNQDFAQFLDEHGHRGPNEWEIASPTWRSHPQIALAALDRMRLAPDERGPHAQRGRAKILREKAQAELLENLGWQDRRNYNKVRLHRSDLATVHAIRVDAPHLRSNTRG